MFTRTPTGCMQSEMGSKRRQKDLAAETGLSTGTICRAAAEMAQMPEFRHGVIGSDKGMLIDTDVFWKYWRYHKAKEPEERRWIHERE